MSHRTLHHPFAVSAAARAVAAAAVLMAVLLAVTAAPHQAAAQNPPDGELLLEKGTVKIRHQGKDRIVRRMIGLRVPVYAGDVISTGRNTSAKLFMRKDADEISLFSNTNLTVAEVTPRRSRMGFSLGKAWFKIFSRLGKDSFQVRTTTATIGIKGTEFVAGTDGIRTYLLTREGTVGLSSVDFPQRVVLVRPNQASAVRAGETPTRPIRVPPALQQQIVQEEGFEQFEQVPFAPPVPETGGDESEEGGGQGGGEDGDTAGDDSQDTSDAGADDAGDVVDTGDVGSQIRDIQSAADAIQNIVESSTGDVRPTTDVGPVIVPDSTPGGDTPVKINIRR